MFLPARRRRSVAGWDFAVGKMLFERIDADPNDASASANSIVSQLAGLDQVADGLYADLQPLRSLVDGKQFIVVHLQLMPQSEPAFLDWSHHV